MKRTPTEQLEEQYPSYRGTATHKWDDCPRYRVAVCYENPDPTDRFAAFSSPVLAANGVRVLSL